MAKFYSRFSPEKKKKPKGYSTDEAIYRKRFWSCSKNLQDVFYLV